MRFNSFIYFAFLPLIVAILWVLPVRLRKWWLLAASFVFYASWHFPYLALLIAVGALNHFGARWIIAGGSRVRRGTVVLAGDLVLLALFKYLDWLVGNVNLLSMWFGRDLKLPIPHWIFPLGISFFMFEAISYTVDVIRKRERVHSFWDFQLFMAFFPKLIAGPILRAKEFLPQIEKGALRPSLTAVREGIWLLASGLFVKLVLADGLGPAVDEGFARSPRNLGAADVYLLAVAFGLQIYFDFSSYTRMAIGSAKLCGIELVENFDYPYSARSPVEFWSRWHMSLSRWIRDYLFFPLLGKQPTIWSMCRAALIAMALCGLWHGAGWHYLLWGLYHGVLICGVQIAAAGRGPAVTPAVPHSWSTPLAALRSGLGTLATFALVSLGWVFFRSSGLAQAMGLFGRALQPWQDRYHALPDRFYLQTALLVLLVWLAPVATRAWNRLAATSHKSSADSVAATWRTMGIGLAEGLCVGCLVVLSLVYFHGQTEFIYSQF